MLPLWLLLIAVLVAAVILGIRKGRGSANTGPAEDPDRIRQ